MLTAKKKKKIKAPDISDHALVRYFERVLGFDLEAIKGEILSETFLKVWKVYQPPRARIPFCEGYRVVIQDCIVVTIVGRRDKKKGIRR